MAENIRATDRQRVPGGKSFETLDRIYSTDELPFELKACAAYLWNRVNRESGLAFPSQATMARELSRSERTVRHWLAELHQRGVIRIHRTRRGNQYRLDENSLRPAAHCRSEPDVTGSVLPELPATSCRSVRKQVAGPNRQPTTARTAEENQHHNIRENNHTDEMNLPWKTLTPERLRNLVQTQDHEVLTALFRESVRTGWLPDDDAALHRFLTAARYVCRAPPDEVRNPVAVLIAKIRDGDWRTGSEADEAWAGALLRTARRHPSTLPKDLAQTVADSSDEAPQSLQASCDDQIRRLRLVDTVRPQTSPAAV